MCRGRKDGGKERKRAKHGVVKEEMCHSRDDGGERSNRESCEWVDVLW